MNTEVLLLSLEENLLAFLKRKYVQREVVRQSYIDTYTLAATDDLAKEVARFVTREFAKTDAPFDGVALESDLFVFLKREFTQEADARQKSMGLAYMSAATVELANQLTEHISQLHRRLGKTQSQRVV